MVKFLLYSVILFTGISAFAAAWQQKSGKSELITSFESKTLATYFNDPDTKQNSLYKTYEFDVYNVFYQYGVNEDYNIGFDTKWYNYKGCKSSALAEHAINADDSLLLRNAPSESLIFFSENESYLNDYYSNTENKPLESKVFIQKSLWSSDNSILSIRPAIEFNNYNWEKSLELRLLYGQSFKLASQYSFVNVETSVNRNTYKFFKNTENDTTFHLDLTLGLGVSERNTIMMQSFYSYNGYNKLEENNGEISLVFKYNEYVTWQNGYNTNLNNRKDYISESYITSLWFKF